MPEIVTIKMFTNRERILLFRRLVIAGFIVLTAIIILSVLLGIITHREIIHILLSILFVSNNAIITKIAFLGLFCGYLVKTYFICKKVTLRPTEIEIINGLNLKKIIPINNIDDFYIKRSEDLFEKNWDIYYIHIVSKNNKHINLSEFIHIDTLLRFLHKFMEYYGDKLTPRCRSSIQEFINQAEGGITNR